MGKDDSKDRQKHQKDKTEKSKKHSTKKHDKDSKNVSKSRDKSDNKHDDHNSSQKSDITTKADPHKPLLGDVITFGLLSFPVLHSELPTMINALDENRGIMTINIDDKELRSYLDNLMTYLPVKHIEREGWCKDNDQLTSNSDERGHNSASIRSYILNELLKSGAIVQPSDMTSNQSHSSRFTASKLLNIASKYPSLIPDIQPILSSIYDGGAVNIDELDNEEVSEMLGDFLSSLGLKNSNNDDSDSNSSSSEDSEEEEGYQIPSTAITQDIRSRLKYFVDSLDSYNKYLQYHNKQHNANANDQSVQRIEQDNDSIASSDSESGDNAKSVDSTHQSDPMSEEAVRRIGPSLPAFQHSLQQSRYSIHEDEDEDDIDHSVDIGPTLPSETGVHTSSSAPRMDPNIPLGFIGVETYKEEFTESNIDDTISQNISAREEWMLTPGERDPFSGLKDGTNRKFQAGKGAKKLAEILTKQREEYEKSMNSEEAQQTRAVIDEYNAKRGPSLMDQHLTTSKKPKYDSTERQPFDRERDILSHKKMDTKQVEKLVENARKLDSRFSKGYVQRSFT